MIYGIAGQIIPQKWNAASIMSILCKKHDTLMKSTASLGGWDR
jgi:hypothetical protein